MATFERDERGLLNGVEYKMNDDGSVNWRSMIPPQFLVIQKDYEKEVVARYNKDLRDLNPLEVDDRYLMILLGGIKHVLRLRGYRAVKQHVDHVDGYKAVTTCTIDFIPNFETGGEPVSFSDTSSATMDSVSGHFKLFLEAIAANRAFVRAVRNALGINIVAKDEFDERASKTYATKLKNDETKPSTEEPESFGNSPSAVLAKRCGELKITFEKVKERAVEIKNGSTVDSDVKIESDPSTWTDFGSIQKIDAYTLITKINEAVKAKSAKKS